MGRHSLHTKTKVCTKVCPIILLTVSVLSALSPLAILLLTTPPPAISSGHVIQRIIPLKSQGTTIAPSSTPSLTTTTTTTAPARPSTPQRQRQSTTGRPSPTSRQTSVQTTTTHLPSAQTQIQTPSSLNAADVAKKYIDTGIPYVYGGNSITGGMDCSHFVWMIFKEMGKEVPYRDSHDLVGWVQRVRDPQPGDLVLYSGHVAIYASQGMMIDQSSSGGAHLREIHTQNFIGYGRIPI